MALMNRRKTRMYEPWGYREENNYQSSENIREDDLSSFFADVEYKRSDNKIHFSNKNGEEVGTLNVNDFIKSDQIVEKAWYEDGKIYVKFTNGDLITVDVKELLDENEFKDGLQVNDGQVSVLIDAAGEGYEGNPYLSTSENGVKISGIDKHIFDAVEAERVRATGEEARLDGRIDQEITDRTADVDAEETRAKAEEAALNTRVDRLNDALDAEKAIREAADIALDGRITTEVNERKAEAVASAEYVESAKTIDFKNASGNVISQIDATPFLKDGMIDDVRIENGKLIIVFNTESGKETIEIPLTDIFNPDNYYTKDEIDEKVSTINDNISDEVSARESGDTALDGKIDALEAVVNTKANTTDVNAALDLKADKAEIPTDFYTKGEVDGKDNALQAAIDANAEAISAESARAISAETDLEITLSGKADADVVYTQEEVDALIKAKETEIYNLTKLVGEIGGNVTYDYPNELGTSLTSLLNNSGTVKLGEDATISRFGPGIMAKNKVKLNLNNHDLTATGATTQPAIMARGTQEITIYGKGTVDAISGICIEANGADSVINLTGSTTVYQNDRSGGELIYCYAGTINITNGTFKNNGADKKYMLNCYDANYAAGTAKIIVTGGKFYDFNPADNNAEGEHTSFVPEGYHVETSTVVEEEVEHTVYTVKKDA